jgi:hypothetical protein
MAWEQIEQALYADVIAFQKLKKFEGYAANLYQIFNRFQLLLTDPTIYGELL